MHIVLTVLIVLNTNYAASLNKCCDRDSSLTKNNSIYVCDKNEDKRVQIFTKDANFFTGNLSLVGECLDVNQNIVAEYKIKNGTVVEKEIVVNFFNKCCPLGYFYHSVAHSCVEKNHNEDFISQDFVRVGLPQCKVIVDYRLTSGSYDLDLGKLSIGSIRFQGDQFCVDKDQDDRLMARGCHEDLTVCYKTRCIRKCCPDGQSFVDGQNCKDTYVHGLNLSFSDRINNSQDHFAVRHGYGCRIYLLEPMIQFYLDTDGTLYAFSNYSNSFIPYGIDKENSYCIEHALTQNLNNFEFFMCFPDEPTRGKFLVTRWAKILSCIFIVATMAVYIFLPEMLNLFGKTLLSYCTAVLVAFLLFIYNDFQLEPTDKACVATSFLSSYMSLSFFTWLNVMSFDIWWTFGTPKSFATAKQHKGETKRFVLYSLYGWGTPAILTLITFLAYGVFNTPYIVRPFLGSFKCFWERRNGNYGKFLYYTVPLIFMQIANLFFFVRTIVYCLRVKKEINKLNDNKISVKGRKKYYNLDKEQLVLMLKLSVTMGFSFVFEVVSSFVDFCVNPKMEYVEIIWDTINCLQGIYIFVIFICKRKVFNLCKNKVAMDRKFSLSSLHTTTTQFSVPLNKFRNV